MKPASNTVPASSTETSGIQKNDTSVMYMTTTNRIARTRLIASVKIARTARRLPSQTASRMNSIA